MDCVVPVLPDCDETLVLLEVMTNSVVIETIVVLGIVAVALVYVLRRVIKASRGKGDCGCGCGKSCKCNQKPGKEY